MQQASAMRDSRIMPTVIIGQRTLLREGLVALLHRTSYKVVASVAGASELRGARSLATRRTLVILGVDEANGNVAEATTNISLLRSLFPDSRIVVVTEMQRPVDVRQILPLALDGYIVNPGSREILLKLLDLALMDQQVIVLARPTPLSPSGDNTESDKCTSLPSSSAGYEFHCSSELANISNKPQLSKRELQVLTQLAQGGSNKVIARLCDITESTVKVHLKSILRKIGAHNRTQAAIWAIAYRSTLPADHSIVQTDEPVSLTPKQTLNWVSGNGASALAVNRK
jgi:two-component system nitrate/nitrite response regulator NarL